MISAGNAGISPREDETSSDKNRKTAYPYRPLERETLQRLTVAHRAALVLGLDGPGAGQHRADDRVADHRSLLQEAETDG